MNRSKAYVLWAARRSLLLLFAAAAAALLGVFLGVEEDLRPSARVALLAVVAVVEALFAAVAGLTLVCHRLHRSRRRGEARVVRRLLEPAERLVAPAVLLLLPVALAPAAFRLPPAVSAPLAFEAPVVRRPPPPPPRAPVAEDVPAPAAAPAEPPQVAAAEPAPPPPLPVPVSFLGGQDDNDVFRLLREDLELPAPRFEFSRLGVPEEGRPLDGRPISLKLDTLMLWEDDEMTGSGLSLRIDIPFDGGPILRLSTLALEADLSLTHNTLDAVFRVLGGTRHAPVDLWVSAGLAVDSADANGLSSGARLSPHVAIDIAFWQTERVGFELRVGQTIPVALTGGSAAITEAALALRIDLSERVSLRAGWRHVVLHLHDYEDPLETEGLVAEVDRDLSGPFVGLEVRF